MPNLGPNFCNLGIAELPPGRVSKRLRLSSLSDVRVVIWDKLHPVRHLWTDGSLPNGNHYWWITGGYSVVSAEAELVHAGEVCHPAMSSYTTELFALLIAFATSESPIVVHSDCDSLVAQVQHLVTMGSIQPHWSHITWWNFILDLWRQRRSMHECPLWAQWCKSHLVERVPTYMLNETLANSHGSTLLDIVCNRAADSFAKIAAMNQHVDFEDISHRLDLACKWQNWLVDLQALLSTETDEPNPEQVCQPPEQSAGNVIALDSPLADFKNVFPRWRWDLSKYSLDWQTAFVRPDTCQLPAQLSLENWVIVTDFLCSLKRALVDEGTTSFMELAFNLKHRGMKLVGVNSTPACYAAQIRKVINIAYKRTKVPIVPGSVRTNSLSNGRTHPAGYLSGVVAEPCIPGLKALACSFVHFHLDQVISRWDFVW